MSRFDANFLRNIRSLSPNIRLASTHTSLPDDIDGLKDKPSIEAVHLNNRLVISETDSKLFHDSGVLERACTVSKESCEKDLSHFGFDMVMSDCPEKMHML